MNNKYTTKFLYSILYKRGFENPSLVLKWNTFHPKASEFFPIALKNGHIESQKILYLKPQNKMASISFSYIKQELLYSLNTLHGFQEIKDIILS